MALSLHTIKPAKGSRRTKVRIGRGDGSGIGSYSGKGIKGQRARSGGRGGLKLKGLKANIQNLPKLSGFKSLAPRVESVNVGALESSFKKGDVISSKTLAEKGLISSPVALVKILGNGKLSKSFTVKVNRASASAVDAIKQAGGKVFLDPQFITKNGKVTSEKSKQDEDASATPQKEDQPSVGAAKKKPAKKTAKKK